MVPSIWASSASCLTWYGPEIFAPFAISPKSRPSVHNTLDNNSYALGANASGASAGSLNPYTSLENLPRTNARGWLQ